ncbi:S1 family peptidase [Glaciecola sp. 2405UD65-10]|uniref:S1 family peptidase n=1 Tax=Glaciecola sp. 2405UD65-10 TaxID=3397244 RepID=UPI003B5BB4C5
MQLSKGIISFLSFALLVFSANLCFAQSSKSLVEQMAQQKPSIVGIGLYTPLESNTPVLRGTGFVVGNGNLIATNYHVVNQELSTENVQHYVALSGEGMLPKVHKLTLIGIDPLHDLALLSIEGTLPALPLASSELIAAGNDIHMIGFPIGLVLGLYPAIHSGIVAAVAPDANPARNADELTIQMFKRLKEPFLIYQLDITAFPGNSGSPIFKRDSGEVIGVLNKVFVSAGKEAALSNPSGISYAIPIKYLKKLASDNDLEL